MGNENGKNIRECALLSGARSLVEPSRQGNNVRGALLISRQNEKSHLQFSRDYSLPRKNQAPTSKAPPPPAGWLACPNSGDGIVNLTREETESSTLTS